MLTVETLSRSRRSSLATLVVVATALAVTSIADAIELRPPAQRPHALGSARQPHGAPARPDQRHRDRRRDEPLVAAQDLLLRARCARRSSRGAAFGRSARRRSPRGFQEIDLHVAHGEGEAFRRELAMMDAEQPQIVGAPALHEMQIARVIDAAGKIRVLEIDALEKLVAGLASAGRQSRPSSDIRRRRRRGSICAMSGCEGAARPRCAKAFGVSSRPRGVRCTNPCWIR